MLLTFPRVLRLNAFGVNEALIARAGTLHKLEIVTGNREVKRQIEPLNG